MMTAPSPQVPAALTPDPALAPTRRWLRADLIAALVCLALAVISVLSLPSTPGYDVFAWIVWGHELAHHVIGAHQAFITNGGPSWKPLPVVFTTIFGFFGASVKLWVIFARAAGFFGFYAAYRVGSQLAASERWRWAGPVAGGLSALGVLLTAQWTHYMFAATSEPMVVTATLYAINRHLAGRRMTAFWCGVALALMRPESSPFLLLYAIWCAWTMPQLGRRLVLLGGLVLVPLAWTVPTAVAGGGALLASSHALAYNGDLGNHPLLEVLKRATNLSVWPVIVAAGALTVWAVWRRERVILALAALALGYVVVVEVMTAVHYPGLERFMLPAASVAAVLAGVAVARAAALAGGGVRSLAIAAVLVAIGVPFFAGRIGAAGDEFAANRQVARTYSAMLTTIRHAGGVRHMYPCDTSRTAINHTLQTSLAWALQVPLTRVLAVTRDAISFNGTALALYAPTSRLNGGRPHHPAAGLHQHFIGRSGRWKLYRITRPGRPGLNACVGY